MSKKWTVTAVAVFVFCIVLTGCKQSDELFSASYFDSDEEGELILVSETEQTETNNQICVYVCGEVNAPGVYYFSDYARICDAILAAGGFSDEAACDYLNQAELLCDGEMIYVPTVDEAAMETNPSSTTSLGIDSDGIVNINYATVEELQTLSGIGQTRAEAIVEYRETHGLFDSTEEIMNVSGIGESTYERIKNNIKVN